MVLIIAISSPSHSLAWEAVYCATYQALGFSIHFQEFFKIRLNPENYNFFFTAYYYNSDRVAQHLFRDIESRLGKIISDNNIRFQRIGFMVNILEQPDLPPQKSWFSRTLCEVVEKMKECGLLGECTLKNSMH